MTPTCTFILGDALEELRKMPDESVNCCVTSPPYWALRDYGVDGQIGLEKTPEEYVSKMVEVFREVRRVLRKDGTCWVNMGDSYARDGGKTQGCARHWDGRERDCGSDPVHARPLASELNMKPKDLIGIPWRLAFALQADGWWLRSDIIWSKPNPMPESVTDRPTKAHEYIFLLTRSARYWYDADAIRTEPTASTVARLAQGLESQEGSYRANGGAKTNGTMKAVGRTDKQRGHSRRHAGFNERWDEAEQTGNAIMGANARTVWNIATQPYPEAHFATFPEEIPKRCILAGCEPGGIVLDPFAGSFTTCAVALSLGRNAIGIEINPEYVEMGRKRVLGVTPALL